MKSRTFDDAVRSRRRLYCGVRDQSPWCRLDAQALSFDQFAIQMGIDSSCHRKLRQVNVRTRPACRRVHDIRDSMVDALQLMTRSILLPMELQHSIQEPCDGVRYRNRGALYIWIPQQALIVSSSKQPQCFQQSCLAYAIHTGHQVRGRQRQGQPVDSSISNRIETTEKSHWISPSAKPLLRSRNRIVLDLPLRWTRRLTPASRHRVWSAVNCPPSVRVRCSFVGLPRPRIRLFASGRSWAASTCASRRR